MPPSDDLFITALHQWGDVFMRRSMRNIFKFAKDSGLSMSQIGALTHIYRGSGGVSDIGSDLGVTSAAASQMLDRLVQLGIILRTEDPRDRRVKQIELTPKGHSILEESFRVRDSWLADLTEVLSAEEKEQILAGLKILIEKTRQLEEQVELEG